MAGGLRLVEANPMAEELRGQVCVKRGPVVYCLENIDIEGATADGKRLSVNDIILPADAKWTEVEKTISGHSFTALQGEALVAGNQASTWNKKSLYRTHTAAQQRVKITLIPYYAWDNRGADVEMSVWLRAE